MRGAMAASITKGKRKAKGARVSVGAGPRDALTEYLMSLRLAGCAPLPPEEERALTRALKETGDLEAAHRLARAHLRLVVKIARECARSPDHMLELIQEGNLGLLKALSKFDPDRGTKFAT